ncbi:MAG: hypothetical protein AB7K09_20145 [Planctomycetota bacterium]
MELNFEPQRGHLKKAVVGGGSFTRIIRRQTERRQTRYLLIALVITAIGGAAMQFVPGSAPVAGPDNTVVVVPPGETTEADALIIATAAQIGQMTFRDDPETTFDKVRFAFTREQPDENGRMARIALVYTRAADGLWAPHEVGLGQTIPGTALRIVRIDPLLAFARDETGEHATSSWTGKGTIYRLFDPAHATELDNTYHFRNELVGKAIIERARTAMWTRHTGSRRILGIPLVSSVDGGEIADIEFRAMVDAFEQFAVEFDRMSDPPPAAVALAEFIKKHKLRCVVAPEHQQVNSATPNE